MVHGGSFYSASKLEKSNVTSRFLEISLHLGSGVSGGRVAPVYSEQARPEKQRFPHAQEQRFIPTSDLYFGA